MRSCTRFRPWSTRGLSRTYRWGWREGAAFMDPGVHGARQGPGCCAHSFCHVHDVPGMEVVGVQVRSLPAAEAATCVLFGLWLRQVLSQALPLVSFDAVVIRSARPPYCTAPKGDCTACSSPSTPCGGLLLQASHTRLAEGPCNSLCLIYCVAVISAPSQPLAMFSCFPVPRSPPSLPLRS